MPADIPADYNIESDYNIDLIISQLCELHGLSWLYVENNYTLEIYYKINYFKAVEKANIKKDVQN